MTDADWRRFWAKVDKCGPIPAHRPELAPCWIWTAGLQHGYGCFWSGSIKTRRAHRIAYEAQCGPLSPGLVLDHLCRERRCVNPAHLEVVTDRENILRGEGTGARFARRTHCKRGHELPEADRGKPCKLCIALTKRAYNPTRNARRRELRRLAKPYIEPSPRGGPTCNHGKVGYCADCHVEYYQ